MGVLKIETLYHESISDAIQRLQNLDGIDVVIGIPFYNERETLPEVIKVVEAGLADLHLLKRALIVCVGDPAGAEALQALSDLHRRTAHLEFLMLPGCNGRGASIRAILQIADELEADVVIFAADLIGSKGGGIRPDWLKSVLEPIRNEYDFVITTLRKNYLRELLGSLFVAPLLEVFYGFKVKGTLCGVYAIAHDTAEKFLTEIKFWDEVTQAYGIDTWLVTRAIRWNVKICEADLGACLVDISHEKLNLVFRDMAWALFECIKRDETYWVQDRQILRTPDICYNWKQDVLYEQNYTTQGLIAWFARGFSQYKSLFDTLMPEVLAAELSGIASDTTRDYRFPGRAWANTVYHFLFHFWFATDVSRDDILNALTHVFCGRLAGFIEENQSLHELLKVAGDIDWSRLLFSQMSLKIDSQRNDFLRLREVFIQIWEKKALEIKPPLIPKHYLEFIPGVPIVLQKELEGRGGRVIHTVGVFDRLQSRYQKAFHDFIFKDLQVPVQADAHTTVRFLTEFMYDLEATANRLLPGDLYTEEGTRQVMDGIFRLLPIRKAFSIRSEILREALLRFPPLNVMIPSGCKSPRELVERMDVRDAITMGNLLENRKWADGILLWILDNVRPDGMDDVEMKHIVLGERVLGGSVKLVNISDLNKLTNRIVVRPLSKGTGGDFPKLRYCLFIARHLEIAENYADLWRSYARERKNLGDKLGNSLIGRYETGAFSAHNIFENTHHRVLVDKLRIIAEKLAREGNTGDAHRIRLACDGYGLSQVLADGTFVPCSAWSWASYSCKGGSGVPTPMSCHVEERWFNHDFLEAIYAEMGYDPGDIMQMVVQLISEGRASLNLLDVLLGIESKDVTVVVQEMQDYPPAGQLVRYSGNPILNPIKEHYWESRYVLNAAAFRINDLIYVLYRAYGDDEVSRIGLAVTDGYNVLERLPDPVFVPEHETEKKGVEDPRVVIIDDRLYMLYTAYDGVIAQISFAAISVDNFLNRRFDRWERKGLAFEDVWDKDAILFPEKINDKYVFYHRIEPGIWLTYLDRLEFPAPKGKHAIIMGPRSGMMWDSLKIGAGAQPFKTEYGWLMIYHGVDRNRDYRLGVMLTDINNPERLIYRSPNPILSPETTYEIGRDGECWVPRVVFTCGAVPAKEKEVLGAEDELLVYYGAADTCLCLATGKIGDLIPESVRRAIRPDLP